MRNLNYNELRAASRTNVGSDKQVNAMNEMIIRATAINGSCTGHSHAMDILDKL